MNDDLKSMEKALFEAAIHLPDEQLRDAFLDQACGKDDGLRKRLGRLLAAHTIADKFLEIPVEGLEELVAATASALSSPASPGSTSPGNALPMEEAQLRIGRYQLIERIGEGGYGVVYRAEQLEPFRRQVALKIIRLGMDTERVIARFEVERQALALMNHPNIAQVLDAGVTESGRPYFVMELVDGVRITDFCDNRQMPVVQRIELFLQVCNAIQHAHQKGILHRDIKPSNVLIAMQDGAPVPKVIDFGIAKAVEGRLTDTTVTAGDQFIGTPAYMSPEQAERGGIDVDTRSDIYSLGVLLYELLTGIPPFDPKSLSSAGVDEMRRLLRESEPPLPSAMLETRSPAELAAVASRRQTDLSRLRSLVKGDLDWILMMALEKERQQRYPTANGLAADLQRYLKDEPISARPYSGTYRLKKLVRRNKATFSAIAAITAALVMGLGTSTWLFLKERDARFREAGLRMQAEKSEQVSRAAFLVRQGKVEEASRLLEEIDSPPARPSLDGVSAYRSVGDWLAVRGRWKEALKNFAAVIQLGRLDVWNPVTLDYQSYAVLLMESGDMEGYKQFCESAAADYAKESNGDAACRVLKSCLLRPVEDSSLIERLQPLAATNERWFNSLENRTKFDWPAIPSGLWEYRNGNFSKAEEISRKSIALGPHTSARPAIMRVILAMTLARSGQQSEAELHLSQAGSVIEAALQGGLDRPPANSGAWYDWLFADILLREASALIPETAAVPAGAQSTPTVEPR